ncbi:MAG: hypothetical protein J6C19_01495 [Lachnospiraceae bacterium]|nr:hypothetical protein [Lachnospiraceae bacterium]
MISGATVRKIEVCWQYFSVNDEPIKKYSDKFDVEDEIHVNEIMSKKEAVAFIETMDEIEQTEFSELNVSVEPLDITCVEDFTDEKVFITANERICGWLFQYDALPFANWYHDCCYYFVVNETCYYKVRSRRGLSDSIKMESV